MDPWLTDRVKEALFQPCLETSGHIGRRLEYRLASRQPIDERALTEDFVDQFDAGSPSSSWGRVASYLSDQGIYLHTRIRKSTREHLTGADIGLRVRRNYHRSTTPSSADYAVLIQCKLFNEAGIISDFYHEVKSSGKKQSALMLDITPSSFYFLFTPPSLVKTYSTIEPMAFASSSPGCSAPIWNMGCFEVESATMPFLTAEQKATATGILVVPALAVEAQRNNGRRAGLSDLLPNCVPLWYWFGELLVPGFIGDRRPDAISVATNTRDKNEGEIDFSVRYSIELSLGTG